MVNKPGSTGSCSRNKDGSKSPYAKEYDSNSSSRRGSGSTTANNNGIATSSPTLSPTTQSYDSSHAASTVALNSSLTSLAYSSSGGTATANFYSMKRTLCFVCLEKSADSSLPVNRPFLNEAFPSYTRDIAAYRGACGKCYQKLTELETLHSFKQFCDLMFEEAKSELEQLFDLSRHAKILVDLEQQEHLRKCLSSAPETNLIGSLQVDDDLPYRNKSRSPLTVDSENTGSSPLSSGGESGISKGYSNNHHCISPPPPPPPLFPSISDEDSSSSTANFHASSANFQAPLLASGRLAESLGGLLLSRDPGKQPVARSLSLTQPSPSQTPQSADAGSRVNLDLQLAENLIKDAIRTASFSAGYSSIDYNSVSVNLKVDASNPDNPIKLRLNHQPESRESTLGRDAGGGGSGGKSTNGKPASSPVTSEKNSVSDEELKIASSLSSALYSTAQTRNRFYQFKTKDSATTAAAGGSSAPVAAAAVGRDDSINKSQTLSSSSSSTNSITKLRMPSLRSFPTIPISDDSADITPPPADTTPPPTNNDSSGGGA